jgi:hypothetical protein
MHCKRCLTAAALLAEKSYLFSQRLYVIQSCSHTVMPS